MRSLLTRQGLLALFRFGVKFVALGALSGALWSSTGHGRTGATQTRVTAANQPDSPLLIVPASVDSSNPLGPQYVYLLTNVSAKPVRAFAIRESVNLDGGLPHVGTEFAHFPEARMFLRPNETRQEEGGRGSTYRTAPARIELAVDFVEFADGTRWGGDAGGSGDRLDGIRAGARAAIAKYRDALHRQGAPGLEQALAGPPPQPEGRPRSDAWAAGFQNGVSIVNSRLSKAKAERGQEGLTRELLRPFDSTEGRQDY